MAAMGVAAKDTQRSTVTAEEVGTSRISDEVPSRHQPSEDIDVTAERRLRAKIDLRLCTIAAILASLDLLDSNIISNAAVTPMLSELGLDIDNRFSVSIFIFTVANVAFQLPAAITVRLIGPRLFFTVATCVFGLLTLCTAFVTTWKQMIALRVLLGIAMSGIYPGLTVLISAWYTREEQQLRFAYLQAGQVIIFATGGIVNYGLNNLDGRGALQGWQYMFLVQGAMAILIGLVSYPWMVDFPELAHRSWRFLTPEEQAFAVKRINADRADVARTPFAVKEVARHFLDAKIYAFSALLFLQNMVSTALAYFLPTILQTGMGFSSNKAILLSAPPYYYSAIPALLTSRLGDKLRLRGPIIFFNCVCLIAGFAMFGFADSNAARYAGVFLATGAYVSNWAAMNSYQANNITGQWKRVVTAASVTAFNGLGGIAGSYIVKGDEAPRFLGAVWIGIGSHILIIVLVAFLTAWFMYANHRQRLGKMVIEGLEGFRYTY